MFAVKEKNDSQSSSSELSFRWRFSLRGLILAFTTIALLSAWIATTMRLRSAEAELAVLRRQTGYLEPSRSDQVAAVRVPSEQPLTFRLRVRVPGSGRFRVAYSTFWPSGSVSPEWYSAVELPAGESQLIVQIHEDPRDDRWKITTTVRCERGTKRMATVLPDEHVRLFRKPNDAVSTGIGRQTTFAAMTENVRLLDERWQVGEAGLLLYGNREPESDVIGIFAELQPDDGPL